MSKRNPKKKRKGWKAARLLDRKLTRAWGYSPHSVGLMVVPYAWYKGLADDIKRLAEGLGKE